MSRSRFRWRRTVSALGISLLLLASSFPLAVAQVPAPAADASASDGIYTPFTNREIYQLIASDYQEISKLTNQVLEGNPLPAGEILSIYEEAKIARIDAQSRPLREF